MKKTILSLSLLVAFSTNINANEIQYVTSDDGKKLEELSKWYFNNLEEKKQEDTISKNKTNSNTYNSNNVFTSNSNTQKNVYVPNYDINDNPDKKLTKEEFIEQRKQARELEYNKRIEEIKQKIQQQKQQKE